MTKWLIPFVLVVSMLLSLNGYALTQKEATTYINKYVSVTGVDSNNEVFGVVGKVMSVNHIPRIGSMKHEDHFIGILGFNRKLYLISILTIREIKEINPFAF
jgi:hypothetical protein